MLLLVSRAAGQPQPLRLSQVGGSDADDWSGPPSVSGDGRLVAFSTSAGNLVPGDANGVADVVLWERGTAQLRRAVSMPDGRQPPFRTVQPHLSADGRWLALRADGPLTSETAPYGGVYLVALATGASQLVAADPPGGGYSVFPRVSADGSRVAFLSTADLDGAGGGVQAAFLWTRGGALQRIPPGAVANPTRAVALSDDGETVALVTAANLLPEASGSVAQVYVYDVPSGRVELVSTGSSGPGNADSGDPALSADGSVVAFTSLADNLAARDQNTVVDLFLRNRPAGSTVALTNLEFPGNPHQIGDSALPDLSADGSVVAFASKSGTIVPRDRNYDRDVFIMDTTTRAARRLSLDQSGAEAPSWSGGPSIDDDGATVAFISGAALDPADKNDVADVYLVTDAPAPPGHHATATTGHGHPTVTPTPTRPTATPSHGTATAGHGHPTATPAHGHPTATPTHGHPTATPAHGHPTATPAHGHPTATPDHGHPTATPGHPHPTATPGHGHPTATPGHGHPTATPGPHRHTTRCLFPGVMNVP